MTKTIEELRQYAIAAVEKAKTELLANKSVLPFVLLSDALDGEPETMIFIQPEVMNSGRHKGVLASSVRALVDKHGYFAAIFVSDSFSPGRVNKEIARELYAFKAAMNLNLHDACVAMGLPLFEELLAWVQCVDRSIRFTVRYTRDAAGNVIGFEDMDEFDLGVENSYGQMWFMSNRANEEDALARMESE